MGVLDETKVLYAKTQCNRVVVKETYNAVLGRIKQAASKGYPKLQLSWLNTNYDLLCTLDSVAKLLNEDGFDVMVTTNTKDSTCTLTISGWAD